MFSFQWQVSGAQQTGGKNYTLKGVGESNSMVSRDYGLLAASSRIPFIIGNG